MRPVALVTGGAVRVGRAISLGLSEAGYDVVVNYRSSGAAATDLAREITERGGNVVLAQGDIASEDDIRDVVATAESAYGRLDLVVNNAATFEPAALLSVRADAWDRVMSVNVRGPFLMVKEAARMLGASRGSVINIVDLSAIQPWVEYPHHSVAKAALLQLTKVMAKSLAPDIRVNAIAPGTVLLPEEYSAEAHQRDLDRTPLGRIGDPEDVVRTVLFLAASPFMTGELVVVDGGRSL